MIFLLNILYHTILGNTDTKKSKIRFKMARARINYLNNKDLLIEIHKSKDTFSEFEDLKYSYFDSIIYDLDVLHDDDVCTEYFGEWDIEYEDPKAKKMKSKIVSKTLINKKTVPEYFEDVKKAKLNKIKKADPTSTLELNDIMLSDLIFRYMTYEHIPLDENWPEDKVKKKVSDGFIKVTFPPFQHYIIENGIPRVVGLSHYYEDEFHANRGNMTPKLGHMFMLLVEKISKKGNWRNYTYLDEMKSSALLQLSQVGLQFDEGRGQVPNPFAFYTTVVNNAFKRVLNTEKKNRNIRDDLIEMAGQSPSFSRQMEGLMKPAPEFPALETSDKPKRIKVK